MTDVRGLQSRLSEIEKTLTDSSDQHKDLLGGIQNGLGAVRDTLLQNKLEIDRLSSENSQLKQIIERLLDSLETKTKDALHDKLKNLDLQLNVLLELSGTEAPVAKTLGIEAPQYETPAPMAEPPRVSAGEAAEAPSAPILPDATSEPSADIGQPEKPEAPAASIATAKTDQAADSDLADSAGTSEAARAPVAADGTSAFEEIQNRVLKLSKQLVGLNHPADAPADAARPGDPAPSPEAKQEPRLPSETPSPDTATVAGTLSQAPSRPYVPERDRLAHGAQAPVRSAQVAPRKGGRYLDAEVDYALGILWRLKGEKQSFSLEEIRDLITGKFGLDLSKRDDSYISACLAQRSNLQPSGISSTHWKFGSAA